MYSIVMSTEPVIFFFSQLSDGLRKNENWTKRLWIFEKRSSSRWNKLSRIIQFSSMLIAIITITNENFRLKFYIKIFSRTTSPLWITTVRLNRLWNIMITNYGQGRDVQQTGCGLCLQFQVPSPQYFTKKWLAMNYSQHILIR